MLDLGDTIPFTFATADGDANVTLTIERPDGTTVTPAVTTNAPTLFSATYKAATPGLHRVRWSSDKAAYTDVFNVRPATGELQIVSLDDVRAHMNMESRADDEELRGWISAATIVLERHVHETVARRSFTERFYSRSRLLRVDKTPLLTVTSLARADGSVTWDPSALSVTDGARGHVRVTSGPMPWGDLEVTYTAGYRVIPENYLGATAIIAAHLFETQRMGTMGQPVNINGEVTLQPSGAGWAIPNRAVELLGARPPLVV